jgi:hypothetical protein
VSGVSAAVIRGPALAALALLVLLPVAARAAETPLTARGARGGHRARQPVKVKDSRTGPRAIRSVRKRWRRPWASTRGRSTSRAPRAVSGVSAARAATGSRTRPGTYAVSVEAGAGAIAPAVIGVAP